MVFVGILRFIMLLGGLAILSKGEISSTKKAWVSGTRARLIGLILAVPFPLSFVAGFIQGFVSAQAGVDSDQYDSVTDLISMLLVAGSLLLAVIMFIAWSRSSGAEDAGS